MNEARPSSAALVLATIVAAVLLTPALPDGARLVSGGGLPIAHAAGAPLPAESEGTEGTAAGGTSEVRVEVQFVVPVLRRLLVEPEVLSLPPATASDLQAGRLDPVEPVRLRLYSNTPWELRLRLAGDAPGRQPAALIRIPGGVFAPVGPDWSTLQTGLPAAGSRLELSLRLPLSWDRCPPGDYRPRLEYQLNSVGMER